MTENVLILIVGLLAGGIIGCLIGCYIVYVYVYIPYKIKKETEEIPFFIEKIKEYKKFGNDGITDIMVNLFATRLMQFCSESFFTFKEKEFIAIGDALAKYENQQVSLITMFGDAPHSNIFNVPIWPDGHLQEEDLHQKIYENLQAMVA